MPVQLNGRSRHSNICACPAFAGTRSCSCIVASSGGFWISLSFRLCLASGTHYIPAECQAVPGVLRDALPSSSMTVPDECG